MNKINSNSRFIDPACSENSLYPINLLSPKVYGQNYLLWNMGNRRKVGEPA